VEWSSGMASGAKVRVYATTDLAFVHLGQAYQAIINDLPSQPALHQVSLSYGLGETYMPAAEMQTDNRYFAIMAASGVTVFVSSGDGGSSPGLNGFGDNTGPCAGGVSGKRSKRDRGWWDQSYPEHLYRDGQRRKRLVAGRRAGGRSQYRRVPYFEWPIAHGRGHQLERASMILPSILPNWQIAGVGDFLKNGESDLVLENTVTGEHTIWILNHGVLDRTIAFQTLSGGWDLAGAGDFNGDGYVDLVWENSTTGGHVIWLMVNGVYSSTITLPTVQPRMAHCGSSRKRSSESGLGIPF
jgi:FG-GAP repeat